MPNKLTIIIPDGAIHTNIPLKVLRCFAGVDNVKIHLFSHSPSPPIRFSRYVESFHYHPDILSIPVLIEHIKQVTSKYGSAILMPTVVEDINFVIKNRSEIEPVTKLVDLPTIDALNRCNDKWFFAQFLAKNDIPSPKTMLYSSESALEEDLSQMTFPVVVKPIHGYAGKGIIRFETSETLKDYLQKHHSEMLNNYIVQSYIPGYDMGASVLCRGGKLLAYTIQKGFIYTTNPYAPAPCIVFIENETVLKLIKQVVAKLNWSGVGHFDLRYDEQHNVVRVIEFNPRYWTSLTGSLFSGVNFPYLAALSASDEGFAIPEYQAVTYIDYAKYMSTELRNYRRENPQSIGLHQTDIYQALKDPIPDIFRAVHDLKKSIMYN